MWILLQCVPNVKFCEALCGDVANLNDCLVIWLILVSSDTNMNEDYLYEDPYAVPTGPGRADRHHARQKQVIPNIKTTPQTNRALEQHKGKVNDFIIAAYANEWKEVCTKS